MKITWYKRLWWKLKLWWKRRHNETDDPTFMRNNLNVFRME